MSSKNRLQEFLQKNRRKLPIYSTTKEGPPHDLRFRATVTLDDGLTFQSANFCSTLKQAENAAAEAAIDALKNPNHNKPIQAGNPEYAKTRSVSVTFDNGLTFQGADSHSTIKQAENAVANVAIDAFKNPYYKPIQAVVQNLPRDLSSDSQKEANKLEKEDRITIVQVKDRKVEKLENGLATCKSSMESSPEKSELKYKISQGSAQSFCSSKTDVFTSSRIQVVPLEVVPTSQNPGKTTNNEMINNIDSMLEISGNKTNNLGHNMTACKPEKRQLDEEFIQQSEGRVSSSLFLPELHKNQLHEFAVRSGFDIPYYSCIREGPPHALRFKATVIFNGKAFQSPEFFSSLRQAEHAAAAVALNSEKCSFMDESSTCKNLLQDKAQKEGSPLPEYDTTISGQLHTPTFTCTVKFDGMTFEGKAAKTKKQAEKNAALVAWTALKEGRRSAISTMQMLDEKATTLFCEPSDSPNVQMNNNGKEETLNQSHSQLSHLDKSTDISVVSHLEHSQAFNTDSVKEPVQNMMKVLGNTSNDVVEQPGKKSCPTKYPRGTRIRVMPASESITRPLSANDLSSNGRPWVAVNVTDSRMQSQKNTS